MAKKLAKKDQNKRTRESTRQQLEATKGQLSTAQSKIGELEEEIRQLKSSAAAAQCDYESWRSQVEDIQSKTSHSRDSLFGNQIVVYCYTILN